MQAWWRRSPEIRGRDVAIAACVGTVIALVQFANLLPTFGTNIASDLGDPLPQAWQVAWDGHAAVSQPLSFWQSNQFFPEPDTLAFSDALVGFTPAGLIGHGQTAAIARYNFLFLFAFALAFLAAWLLASELGAAPVAAGIGACAFAWSPWRMQQGPHLHVLSSGPLVLALFLLLRGLRKEKPGLIVAGFAAALWQESIGFSLGLQLDYLLIALGLIGILAWLKSGRPRPRRKTVVGVASGAFLFAFGSWLLMRPYLRVAEAQNALHQLRDLYVFSPHLWSFIAPPKQSAIYGGIAADLADTFGRGYSEKGLYPGMVIVALAVAGMLLRSVPKALRVGLLIGVIGFAILSLGVHRSGIGHWSPFRLLFEFAPGWNGIRTPGRIHTLTSLGLAMLAAFGATLLLERLRQRNWRPGAIAAATAAVALLILVEGSGFPYDHPRVMKAPAALAAVRGPMLQLPAAPVNNRLYLVWSTAGFQQMVNGRSTVTPATYRKAIRTPFPSRKAVRYLQSLGVRRVVIHTEFGDQRNGSLDGTKRLTGTEFRSPTWAAASTVPLPGGVGLKRRLERPLVIYDLPAR